MKSNEHKKITREDKFARYACSWAQRNKTWKWYTRQNRKEYRRKKKEAMRKEMDAQDD